MRGTDNVIVTLTRDELARVIEVFQDNLDIEADSEDNLDDEEYADMQRLIKADKALLRKLRGR